MSKVLVDAALVIGVAAIAVVSAGTLAAPGSALATSLATAATAVGSVAGTTLTVGGLGTVLGLTAAALGTIATLTAPKPKTGPVSPMSWQSDPNAGIDYPMGRIYTGGKIVYRKAWGQDDKNETIVTQIGTTITSFDTLYVDGVATGYTQGGLADITDRGKMYVSTQLGAQPEASQLGALGPPNWTTASKLSGLAATSITLVYDAKGKTTFVTEPQVGWVVHGVKVYDPRKDGTYPGGSGSHRSNDEATWEWSANPYLHALTWLIGRRQNGKLVVGVGALLSAILIPQFVEGANIADANGWTIAGTVGTTDEKWGVLKNILQAGSGQPLRLGAQIGCLVNTPRVSLATIEVGDVVGDASVQATQARRDRLNAIVPRYMAEQSDTTSVNGTLTTTVTWGMVAGSPVVVSDYVTFDGGQRQKQIDYGMVPQLNQSQQLARYDIENSREFGPIHLPLKLRWMGYKPGDVVTANLPELGLNGQDILLLNRALSPQNAIVTMTARSETYAKHAFALGQTGTAPGTPSVTGPALVPTPGSTAWAITGTSIQTGATPAPGLIVTGETDSTTVDAIVCEYRPFVSGQDADTNWMGAAIVAPSVTQIVISSVQANVAYEVGLSYRCGVRQGPRAIYGPVTTGLGATRNAARGEWAAGNDYIIGDFVTHLGSSYSALIAHHSDDTNAPPGAAWALLAAAGATGPSGYNSALVYIFQRGTSAPTVPDATTTYTFASASLTGLDNGWSTTIPSGTAPLYVSVATASASGASDTIGSGEWSGPVVLAQNGIAGLNVATVYIYQRATSAPAVPGGTKTYTFATSSISTLDNGWSTTIPTTGTDPIWVSQATAASTGATDTIATGEWSSPAILAQNGAVGPPLFTLTPRSGCAVSGGTITKTGSSSAWDTGAYTGDAFVGGAAMTFRAGNTGHNMLAGLNSNPTAGVDYNTIDYAWLFNADHNAMWIGISGSWVYTASDGSGWNTSELFQIVYDGKAVRFLRAGALVYSVAATAGTTYFADSVFYHPSGQIVLTGYAAAGQAGADGSGSTVVSGAFGAIITISLTGGATADLEGQGAFFATGSFRNITCSLQWSYSGYDSWNNVSGGSDTELVGPGEPGGCSSSGSLQNTGTTTVLYDVRYPITGGSTTGLSTDSANSFIRATVPG